MHVQPGWGVRTDAKQYFLATLSILSQAPSRLDGHSFLPFPETTMKRATKTNRIDPITVGVINTALAAIAEELTINLARTALSTIVYEVQDFCTGLLDAQGRLVAQAPGGLPLFVGDLDAAVEDGIRIHGENGFQPGDVILTNHTGTCVQHLTNVVVYPPVFFEGDLVGFVATLAHFA